MKLILRSLSKSIVFASALAFCGGTALAETVVIAGPATSVSKLSADDLKALYLGKNKDLTVFDQSNGAKVRQEFLEKVVGKDEAQFKAYWSKLIFTGQGTPPKQLEGDAAVRVMVSSTPGSIGYIDSSSVDGSVKVVFKVQ